MTTENKDEIPEAFGEKELDFDIMSMVDASEVDFRIGYNACLKATQANNLRIKCEQQEIEIREMREALNVVFDEAIVSGKIKPSTIKLIRESISKSQKG